MGPSFIKTCQRYNSCMDNNYHEMPPELERYIALCKRIYEDMERDGTWPWKDETDSTLSDDMVDSGNNPENL